VKETNEDENVSDSCNTALKHEDISDTIWDMKSNVSKNVKTNATRMSNNIPYFN
jgi:hypothetical protein